MGWRTARLFEVPQQLRRGHRELYAAEVREAPDGSRAFHRGRLWRRDGINVLHLEGDRFEMAFQHGRLLRAEIADGSLEQASRITVNAIRNSLGDGMPARALAFYADRLIARVMLAEGIRRLESPDKDPLPEAHGLSEGCGVPVRTIVEAALAAETAQVLLGQTERLHLPGAPAQSGCTSLSAWGALTADGEVIIGRNTDYPLNGYFDRHPTVIYYSPSDGTQRYMTVTSAGFHNAGVCGLNAAGIYLAVHTVPTRHVSARGRPIFLVGQEVLRQARTFDSALSLLRASLPAAGWNYHLVSAAEHRAATVEMACDATGVRPASHDHHVTTNHWTQAEMEERYLAINASIREDSMLRQRRAEELLRATPGGVDVRRVAAILGDKLDPSSGRVRVQPNTIASACTVSSSVWLPRQGRVFVAAGTAPVSLTRYVGLPTVRTLDVERFAEEECPTLANDAHRTSHPAQARAEELLVRAKMAFEYDNDAERTLTLLREAGTADPSEPGLQLLRGMFAVRTGRLDEALAALDVAAGCPFDAQRRLVALYLRGRVHAHLGAPQASSDLRAVALSADAETRLRAAASSALARVERRGWLALDPRAIAPMMLPADAFRYRGLLRP